MTRITWDDIGSRYFDTGVDRGVFYKSDNTGVPWNGLTSVKHKPSGGKAAPYYVDGIKYINRARPSEFEGTIEAYTYPDEFSEYDGWSPNNNGLLLDQQIRKEFGLCYRTIRGNDVDGVDHSYQIHLVYNVLTEPTDPEYATLTGDANPITFAWAFTSRSVYENLPEGVRPLAHVVIDSRTTNPSQLAFIEDYLYGTPTTDPRIPTLPEVIEMFDDPIRLLWIEADPRTGLSPLHEVPEDGDLIGKINYGLYDDTEDTRLIETSDDGLFVLSRQELLLRLLNNPSEGISPAVVDENDPDLSGTQAMGHYILTPETTNLDGDSSTGLYDHHPELLLVETETPGIFEAE